MKPEELPMTRTILQYGVLRPGGTYSFHYADASSAFAALGPDSGTVIRRTTVETVEAITLGEPE